MSPRSVSYSTISEALESWVKTEADTTSACNRPRSRLRAVPDVTDKLISGVTIYGDALLLSDPKARVISRHLFRPEGFADSFKCSGSFYVGGSASSRVEHLFAKMGSDPRPSTFCKTTAESD